MQPNDNGSSHWGFKLKTKEAILVARVTPSPMPESIIDLVNSMGVEEGEVKGVEFRDMFGRVTINNIELALTRDGTLIDNNNDGSNASDNNFELDKELHPSR